MFIPKLLLLALFGHDFVYCAHRKSQLISERARLSRGAYLTGAWSTSRIVNVDIIV